MNTVWKQCRELFGSSSLFVTKVANVLLSGVHAFGSFKVKLLAIGAILTFMHMNLITAVLVN